ncbi:hypothetical protein JW824_09325 [bacterium]|nr:hypothetical protein [bacterium]RQV94293.1 MAG: hypothetical protein EH221_07530 [bacterium]
MGIPITLFPSPGCLIRSSVKSRTSFKHDTPLTIIKELFITMTRNIVHLRIDGFPVAVERLRDASLREKPVVVCSRHSPRSLIFSASREARREGVWEGLPLTKALRRCRRLTVLPPDERSYQQAGNQIMRLLERYSPLVESGPWGRFYMDMTGTARLFGSVHNPTFRIQREVANAMGLRNTLGTGSNKLVSGIAARVIESHGDLYAVPFGSEASFLSPLRIEILPAAHNQKDRTLLTELNIRWVRQLATLSAAQLVSVFGKRGILLQKQALGIDDRPVLPAQSKPFVLEERTLDSDTNDDKRLLGVLYGMMERACREMRIKNVLPRTIWLHIRYTDGMDITRRLRLHDPTVTDPLLFQKLKPLFLKTSFRRQCIRYLSLTFTDLILPPPQLSLFENMSQHYKESRLISALDKIRERYGNRSVQMGRTLHA